MRGNGFPVSTRMTGARNHMNFETNLDESEARAIERYRRAVNYLAAAQIYLRREGVDPPEIAEWRRSN